MTDTQLAQEICREIRAGHKKRCLPYKLEPGDPGILDSKVGGTPYLPRETQWPLCSNGIPMNPLAQIDCTQLAALPDFPHTGLLQFFIGNDDVYGAEFDDMTAQLGFRILYHETVDLSVTREDVAAKQPPKPEAYDSPVLEPCRIVFGQVREQELPGEDYLFEKLFLERWNLRRPEKPLKDLWSFYKLFPEGERDYSIFDEEPDKEEAPGPRHQLDGYPFFTQIDPRREDVDYAGFDTLLFQLDSDGRGARDLVLWGDCGVGNFFIRREALRNRDFSQVLYNWDCC
ncbi:DUF1963 domain-containing protein [Pseudoflavonifractor sp. 60]|uniref:YwqG family protein n=1 Tax=Pseudoflavonifractor sp. 60 TaxID=2304576 RepID=UPI00136D2209|nr:DUF1963 domain-containing protein [Pseudoflavonifractor sp. 60]NBI68070.1 DUF1963 domain-containing protein [Pseudoflavonifractor sp. 60]